MRILLCGCLLVLSFGWLGCARSVHMHPLANDAYVWQRAWTDPLLAALRESSSSIQVWRVLAAEAEGHTGDAPLLPAVRINSGVLRRLGNPVVAVIRIDGRHGATLLSDKLADESAAVATQWMNEGVPVRGLEIDYDCATKRLAEYRHFLHRLRTRIPHDLRLSITALPSWMGSSELPPLLSETDETVLQVHAVSSPRKGLFDRATAYRWAQAWSQLSSVPFRIALPTYWSRVTWNVDGRVEAIESEVDRYGTGAVGRELVVEPSEVAAMVRELHRAPPSHLTGIAWFRLPTSLDQRAWDLQTWHAVMRGETLPANPPMVRFKADRSGAKNVYLWNGSDVDATLPPQVSVSGTGCEFADALPPYSLERQANMIRFQLRGNDLLRAGQERMIGWVRCSSERLEAHVSF